MVVMADTVLATAMDTATERGPLMPSPPQPLRPSLRLRLMPMPTTAMVDTALAMEATAMERGLLMPMPTTAMADTALAMEAMAMAAMVDTDMARGPLMPMPTTATVDTDTAMVDTDT